MMPVSDLVQSFQRVVIAESGFESKRNYLGMSHIGDCPRTLYENFLAAQTPSYRTHASAFTGYMFEKKIMGWIADRRIDGLTLVPGSINGEIVANFDSRYRGHIEAELCDNLLLEIKSLNARRFQELIKKNSIPTKHFLQVQTYMKHSGLRNAVMVYVCRETMEFEIRPIPYNIRVAENLDKKAREVLAAIDAKKIPNCLCGFCEKAPRAA